MGWGVAIMTALSVASTAMTVSEQRKQSKAQQEQSELDILASQEATKQAEQEEAEQTSMDLAQLAREAMRAEATAVTQSAYSGVAGVTSERVRQNVLFQKSLDEAQIRSSAENKLNSIRMQGRQNQRQLEGARAKAIASKPSGLSAGLSIASAGAKGYASGKRLEN